MKHSDDPLEDQLKSIGKWRAALSRRVRWRELVTGSVWFLQIKPIRGGESWHIHLHMLVTGSYVPQPWLSRTWEKITGGSFIVDVRRVKNLKVALSDVCRYVGRPANLLAVAFEYQLDLVHATRRIRLCGTTGICKDGNVSLRPERKDGDEGDERRIGYVETLWGLARDGNQSARAVIQSERTGEPLVGPIDCLAEVSVIERGYLGLAGGQTERAPPPWEWAPGNQGHFEFTTDYAGGAW